MFVIKSGLVSMMGLLGEKWRNWLLKLGDPGNEGINAYTELNLGNQKWICTMESREYAEKSLSRQTLH